ncbi:MAG: hypothetical protein WBG86_18815 [Polyangiales bacterium]
MMNTEFARRMLALVTVAAAVFLQTAMTSGVGADVDSIPELASLDTSDDYGVRLLASDPTEPGPSIHRHFLRPFSSVTGPSGPVATSFAAAATPPAARKAQPALTLLHFSNTESMRNDSRFDWPVTRDSAGAPIVITHSHTLLLSGVAF